MQRDLYQKLLTWKHSVDRKPLVLRGARQVGKTYLLKQFAKNEYSSLIYLNFDEDPGLAILFSQNLKPATLLENIRLHTNQDIFPGETLLFFDEIQQCPEALNSLKYFEEQANEFHIVAAGSLLGIKLTSAKGFPVGKVNFLDLYPLTFMEFLGAIGKSKLREFLMQLNTFSPLTENIHHELIIILKKFMYIGGMPSAVQKFIDTGTLLSIQEKQKEILDAYVLDFAKHAPAELVMKITEVWQSIPSQLAKENKKFIFSKMRASARGREYEGAIQWLADANLIHKSYRISKPTLPLSGYTDRSIFKVFLLDVGLLSAISRISAKSVVEENGIFAEFHGAFTENFIAQELTAAELPLHYWASEGIAEVDFVIENHPSVYPLEVKSGLSRRKKSLLVYNSKYSPDLLLRTSLMNLKKDGNFANLPLYLIGRILQFVE